MKRWGRCDCCCEVVLGVTLHLEPRPPFGDCIVFRCEACEAHDECCAVAA